MVGEAGERHVLRGVDAQLIAEGFRRVSLAVELERGRQLAQVGVANAVHRIAPVVRQHLLLGHGLDGRRQDRIKLAVVEFGFAGGEAREGEFGNQSVTRRGVQYVVAQASGTKLMQAVVTQVHLGFQRVGVAHRRHFAQVDHLPTDARGFTFEEARGGEAPARPRAALVLDGRRGQISQRLEGVQRGLLHRLVLCLGRRCHHASCKDGGDQNSLLHGWNLRPTLPCPSKRGVRICHTSLLFILTGDPNGRLRTTRARSRPTEKGSST